MPINANNGSLMIMTIAKTIMGLMIVGTMCYCIIHQVPFENHLVELVLILIGAKELYSAKVYYESERNLRVYRSRR